MMKKNSAYSILEQLGLLGIVPVIAIPDARHARGLGGALLGGGLACAEVTFRTGAALESISELTSAYPEMLVGAGTVLTTEQAEAAVEAGARFIVSPGLNRTVVEYCVEKGVPVTPGVLTPTEVEAALGLGLDVVKFFPAEASGGLKYLKAISAPYTSLKFIPTGGIDTSNLLLYLRFPRTLACGGSWMVKADLISRERFHEIEKLTSSAVAELLGLELQKKQGQSGEEVAALAAQCSRDFGIRVRTGESPGKGESVLSVPESDICVHTHFIERAVHYLQKKGIATETGTEAESEGRLRSIRVNPPVGGSRVWLVQQ